MKQNILIFASSIVLIGGFFSLTNPQEIPAGLLIIPVLLMFIIGLTGMLVALKVFRIATNHPKRRRAVAVLGGSLMAFILVLQSTGGIVAGDVLLIILMMTMTYIYITKF